MKITTWFKLRFCLINVYRLIFTQTKPRVLVLTGEVLVLARVFKMWVRERWGRKRGVRSSEESFHLKRLSWRGRDGFKMERGRDWDSSFPVDESSQLKRLSFHLKGWSFQLQRLSWRGRDWWDWWVLRLG